MCAPQGLQVVLQHRIEEPVHRSDEALALRRFRRPREQANVALPALAALDHALEDRSTKSPDDALGGRLAVRCRAEDVIEIALHLCSVHGATSFDHLRVELLLGAEVIVRESQLHAGRRRDVANRDAVEAAHREQFLRSVEDAVARRMGADRAGWRNGARRPLATAGLGSRRRPAATAARLVVRDGTDGMSAALEFRGPTDPSRSHGCASATTAGPCALLVRSFNQAAMGGRSGNNCADGSSARNSARRRSRPPPLRPPRPSSGANGCNSRSISNHGCRTRCPTPPGSRPERLAAPRVPSRKSSRAMRRRRLRYSRMSTTSTSAATTSTSHATTRPRSSLARSNGSGAGPGSGSVARSTSRSPAITTFGLRRKGTDARATPRRSASAISSVRSNKIPGRGCQARSST